VAVYPLATLDALKVIDMLPNSRKRSLLLPTIVCLVVLMLLSGSVVTVASAPLTPDMLAVQGRWIRSDAPYIIELSRSEDGSLAAAYFNPRPIHVGRTELGEQDGVVQVLIELQDVNYPGSTYILAYDRSQDRLVGWYFHAGSQQTFDVRFIRSPTGG